MFKKNASRGISITRVLIVSLFIGLTAVITAAAGWTDYIDPFGLFTALTQSTPQDSTQKADPKPTPVSKRVIEMPDGRMIEDSDVPAPEEKGDPVKTPTEEPNSLAPSSSNYTFLTNATSSLASDINANTVDMTTGTTSIHSTSVDDTTSAAIALPFDFFLAGNRYSQFSVTSNGIIALSNTSTTATGSTYVASGGTVTTPIISPFAADLGTGTSGKVHYKTVGTAPNRTLVIEFSNMTLLWTSSFANDGTFQARLYESTGVVEFVYGAMSITSTASASDTTVGIGFSTNTTTNNLVYVTSSTNTASTTAPFTDNTIYPTGAIANLNSASNGSRRTYRFTPPVPSPATGSLTFTSITPSSMTLNWGDAPGEVGYAIYRSTDGGTTYSYFNSAASDAVSLNATGLNPSTTYFWKVYAISEGALSTALTNSQATAAPGNISSTAGGGLWSATGTWVGGVVPTASDNVTIADGATVTIDPTSAVAYSVTVGQGTSGILQYDQVAARTLTVTTDVTVAAGGTFKASATGSTGTVTTNALSIGGGLTNNGTINFSTTAGAGGTTANAAGVQITFTGASDATFDVSNTAAVTNLRSSTGVTLNKGTSSSSNLTFTPPVTYSSAAGATSSGTTITVGSTTGLAPGMFVSVTAGTGVFAVNTTVSSITNGTQFVVSTAPTTALSGGASVVTASKFGVQSASLQTGATAGFLSITNGTFKVGGSNTFRTPFFNATAYSIPATGGFWLNNANATVTAHGASPTMSGLLRMTAGTYNVGTAAGNSMSGATTSSFIIEGGTMNFASRLLVTSASASFNMSAGTINVCTVGNTSSASPCFGFTSASSVFMMSGGNINLVQATTTGATLQDYQVSSSTGSITGGTLNVGTAATATNFNFRIQGAIPALVVDNTGTAKTATLTASTTVFGNITINTGASLNHNATTGFPLFFNGTSVTNNGSIVGTAASTRFDFQGTGAQTYSGTGTWGTAGTPFVGLGVGIANTNNVTLSSPIVTTRVNLFTGQFVNSNQITLGSGAALAVFVQRGGATGAPAGTFDVAPTFNLGTGTYQVTYTTATNAVTTSVEIPATRALTFLTINNTNGVTLAGGNLTVGSGTAGTLTLTLGNLTTSSSNLLTIGSTAVAAVSGGSATSYINGPFARTLPASLASGSTYTFPVGKSAFKLFELVNPTTTAGGTVTLQAEVFDSDAGGTAGTGINSLFTNRYWLGQITAGSGNFTNTSVRLTDSPIGNRIGKSATQAGTYDSIGGTVVGSTILSNAITSLGYFVMGNVTLPAGTYTVGAGGNYTTLTAAVADYNSRTITGPVTFSLTDASYAGETFPITFNANTGSSPTNTLTIKPASGISPTISGSSSTCIITFNGSSYVNVDGSNSVNGTTRDLTLANTNTSGATVCLQNAATNNSVKNSILKGVSTSTANGVVFFSTVASGAIGNSTNTIQNNDITRGATAPAYGVYNLGTSTAKNTGNQITGNRIFDFSSNGIRDDGNSSATTYTSNEIFEATTQSTSLVGFRPSSTSIDSFTFTRNYIHDLNTSSTGTVYGIHLFDTNSAAAACLIANNMIALSATAPLTLRGIYDQTATGEKYNLYANSVFIGGTVSGVSNSAAYNWSIASTSDVRNNIFVNARTGGTGKHYAYQTNTTLANLTSDYNDIYNTGGTGNVFGNNGTADVANLATWKLAPTTGTGKDANSKSADPNFTSPTDLHIKNGAADPTSPVARAGVTISGITTDYDGDTRKATPDIGADEFNTYLLTVGTTAGGTITAPASSPVVVNPGAATTITAVANAGFTFTGWTVIAGSATFGNAALLSTTATISADASVQANFTPTTYQLSVVAGTGGTITDPASSPVTVNHGAATTITAAANTGYTFANWTITSGSGSIANASSASTTITLTSGDATVQANFTLNTYTITATAGANGSISPSGAVSVNHGADQMFTITADPGYHTVDVLVDGVSQGAIPTYTFTNVTAAHTISASFAVNATPTINTTGGPLAFADTPVGGISAEQTFTVGGTDLTANLIVTSPSADFEVSTTTGSGFGSSVSLTPASGTVATTTIYVHFKPATATASGGNISASSTGATTQNVAVSGTGVAGGYYRTKASGDWSDPAIWEVSTDGSTNWVDTYFTPGAANSEGIELRGTDLVSINSPNNQLVDQIVIRSGSVLTVNGQLTVADGTGTDLDNQGGVTVNGTFVLGGTVSGTAFTYGGASTLVYGGTTPQTSTSVEYPLVGSTPTSLTINGAGGVTLHSNRSVSGTFTLTNGILTTDATKMLTVTNTAAGAVVGGSATSYVNGPLRRFMPASISGSSVYSFPVGKGGYNGFELIDPQTTAAAPQVTVEVFDTHPGGFGTTGIENLRDRYWSMDVPVGGFNSTNVRLTDSGLTNGVDQVGFNGDATPPGNYLPKGGTVAGDTIESTIVSAPPGFYAIGGPGPKIEADPFPLDFGNQVILTSSSQQNLTVTNTGSSNLTITGAAITGANPTNFAVTSGPGSYPVVLAPGNSTVYGITFTPSVPGTRTAALRLSSDAENGATYDAELTGNGTAIPTYTITATSGAHGSVTPAGATVVNAGGSQTYTITPDPGYHILDVLVDGSSVGAVSSYTFLAVVANHTISATFAINTYTITASAGANGSISPSGSVSVNHGADQSFTITPNANYHILDVTVDGGSVGASGSYTFTNVTANHTISATFAINTYTITASAGAHGSISPSGAVSVNHGANQSFTITPDAAYHVADLLVDSVSVGAVTSYTFMNVTANHTISATFAIDQYSVTYDANGGTGTLTDPNSPYNAGSTVTVLSPGGITRTGYTFAGWNTLSDGTGTSFNPSDTFTIFGNTTFYAQWTINQYTVSYDGNGNTGGTAPATQTANFGSSITLAGASSLVRTGHTFNGWNTAANGSGTPYAAGASFTIPASNTTLYAQWTPIQYSLFYNGNGNTGGTAPATQTADYGTSVTVSGAGSLVRTGHTFSGWNTMADGSGTPYAPGASFVIPASDTTLYAQWTINTYTITATAGANGSISPSGAVSVNHGDNQTFTITPNAGYHVDVLTVDGSSVPSATSYTFTNVTAAHTIDVTFAINTYTITATAGANGSISPSGAVSVNHGANQLFTITPNSDYHVDVLTVDGGSVPPATSYTFMNVTATHTIDVTFAANPTPVITFDAAPTPTYLGGDFTVNATTTNTDSSALTYSVVSGPCVLVSGATFSSTGAGICQVQASGAATANYTAATATQNVTIAKADQATVTLSGVPSTATYGDTFTAVGGGGSGTGAFSYAVTGTACTVHPSTGAGSVAAVSGGCSVTATRAGDTNYNPATSAPSVIGTINPADQATLTAVATPSTVIYGNTSALSSTGGSGTGAVTFSHGGSTGCSVTGTTLSVTDAGGTCAVTATKAADANYNSATSAPLTVTLQKADQATLTVDDPGTVTYGSTPQMTTSGGSGTGAVTFSDGGSAGCSVTSGGLLTVTDASAACNVTATKAADNNYNAATSAQRTITLAKANQATLTAVATPSSVTYGSTSALSSTGGSGTGAVTFSHGGSTGCSVTGTTLSVTDASGTCEITATKAADNNYNAATSAPLTVTLVKATPTVTFGAAPTPTYLGGNFTVSASTTNTDSSALTYSVVSGPCALVSGATFSSSGAGTCVVQASGAATSNFTTASATQNVTIAKATPVVTFGAAPTPGYPGADFTVSASTTNTDSPALVYSKVSGPCNFVSGATFSSTGAGTCVVRSDGAASTNFNAAFDTQNVTITAVQYTITASAGPNGSITPSGSVVVNSGANQAFTITADAGYHIADVLVDSVSQGPIGSYTFMNVTANHTISATFAINTYTITASAGANGSISPSGSVVVNHGASQSFTITPDGGYNVANVLVDGVSVGAVTSYTFTNVTANHTIAATFFSGTQALIVYVDDNWAGTTLGTDPDGAGPASSFGYDAFATIQDGVAGVALNGTVIVNPGSYTGDINVNRAMDVRGVFTTTGAITVTAPGASVSPGASPGIINSGNLSLTAGSNVNIEVNGPIVGTQYDQLNVTGTVSLANANLNVTVGNAYTPSAGQTFTIVNNDGSDPVTGTFAGLAENDVFYSGTTSFRITYAGGSNNNDVVLTAVALCNSVSIPSYTTLNGNAVVASVNVDDTTGKALQSTDFTLTYNPAVVTFGSASLGTVTAGGVLNINSSTPGTLVVSIFSATPFSGSGSMLDITFNAVGQPGTSTPVAFNAFKFNEGTQCISTANGSVAVISGTITGTVSYGNSIPAATRHVPNTTISAVGSVNASALTNLAGAYSISSLGAGSYTVTPSKSGEVNGAVTGFDAAQIAMWVVGTTTLNATQQTAADVSGTGGISSFDAALIARYAALLPNAGSSGTWRFTPTNTTYANVNVNRTGDYTALLMGDVSGNWIDPLATRPAPTEELKPIVIAAAELSALVNTEVVVPVEISDTTNTGILAYQFELRYDPAVLEPAANPADLADTISSGYQLTVNPTERGLLRVVVFGTQPLSGGGRLLNLRFNAIGNPGSSSDLIWENLGLNEGGFEIRSTNGRVQLTASPSNNASLGGRVLSAEGQPIRNARVTLIDTTGASQFAITNGLGYYQFTGLRLGETYTVRTSAKRHRFQTLTVSVSGDAVSLDIIAQPGG